MEVSVSSWGYTQYPVVMDDQDVELKPTVTVPVIPYFKTLPLGMGPQSRHVTLW